MAGNPMRCQRMAPLFHSVAFAILAKGHQTRLWVVSHSRFAFSGVARYVCKEYRRFQDAAWGRGRTPRATINALAVCAATRLCSPSMFN